MKELKKKDIIWLVDDAKIIHKAIKLVLEGYEIKSFYSGEEFLAYVDKGKYTLPDLILLDILMKELTGFEVLDRLIENMEFRELPVIILSTKESIDDKVKGLEIGAADYIVKPFYEKELSARVRVHIKIKKNQDELRQKVILDFLTNTFNKRHLYSQLKTQFSVFQRHQAPASLIFFDIDHFKNVNDEFGHLTGDFVLKELCGDIKRVIRKEDELYRYGGEEFVILAPFTPKISAEKIAEKIRKRIMNKTFEYHSGKIKVTLSIGVAALPEDGANDFMELLELADKRMLMAKHNGRNRVVSNG